jgi:hypothetical protein
MIARKSGVAPQHRIGLRLLELLQELPRLDAARESPLSLDEDHGHFVVVLATQLGIAVYVEDAEIKWNLLPKAVEGVLCFIAEMAPGTRVEEHLGDA